MQQRSYETLSPIGADRAVDYYLGMLDRDGHAPSTLRSYEYELGHFLRMLPREYLTSQIDQVDYERFLDRWRGVNPKTGKPFSRSTKASKVSLIRGFSKFIHAKGWTARDVVQDAGDTIKRPPRLRAIDLDVVSVSTPDVGRMFSAVENPQEMICLSVLTGLGPRRKAAAEARLEDVDFDTGHIKFSEKGGKVIRKPVPDQTMEVLNWAKEIGVWESPKDYLIPNRRPSTSSKSRRSSKVIYETVVKIAERAGITCHAHALRAAFATQYLTQHPDRIHALQKLMGHSHVETTTVYLRRMDDDAEMESVRDLSFGAESGSNRESRNPAPRLKKAHTGFEPVSAKSDVAKRSGNNQVQSPSTVGIAPPAPGAGQSVDGSDPMRAKLDELRVLTSDLRRKRSRTGARR